MSDVENDLLSDVTGQFGNLSKEVLSSKIEQQNIFAQSAAAGGPVTAAGAIANLMDYLNVGIRQLSTVTNVRRHKLSAMIRGEEKMPPEVLDKIYDVFKAKKPDLFNFDKKQPLSKPKM